MNFVKATLTLTALTLLSACVAVPVGPGYYDRDDYGPAPGYYYGPPVYYGPGLELEFHDGGDHDHHWHRH
jgi:hypothetical protein